MDECRKQFEREIDSFGWSLERTEDGEGYTTATTEAAWWGWKAAYQAGMREAAKIAADMWVGWFQHPEAIAVCVSINEAILKAAERLEAGG